MAGLAFAGMVDAGYLSIEHFQGIVPGCSVTAGCQVVLTSKYAELAGVPISLVGYVWYLTAFVLAIVGLTSQRRVLPALLGLSAVATLVSLVLFYLQTSVLHSLCQYCLVSAGLSIGIFGLTVTAWKKSSSAGRA